MTVRLAIGGRKGKKIYCSTVAEMTSRATNDLRVGTRYDEFSIARTEKPKGVADAGKGSSATHT